MALHCISGSFVQKKGMDGYLYLDHLFRLKFTLFHLLPETYKYCIHIFCTRFFCGHAGVLDQFHKVFQEHTGIVPHCSQIFFTRVLRKLSPLTNSDISSMYVTRNFVSVANNFVNP